jgi:dihydrofolate reductase
MRKIIALEHISLDGVIQAPGGPEEDPSEGFPYGGWTAPFHDDVIGNAMNKYLQTPCDLLLGRKTFDIWEPFWPKHSDIWPNVMTATKYVASNSRTTSEWQPTVFLNGDVAEKVAGLKQEQGPDIHIWGSSQLLQALMKSDLVDSFFLIMFPVTLGIGKRLFREGTIPASFKVTDSLVAPSGVIAVTYERAGGVEVGTVGPQDDLG